MRIAVRTKTTNEPQLGLFTVNALKFPIYETTHSIRPDGGEALAGVPPKNGNGVREQRTAARNVDHGGGADRNGNGRDSPEADSAGSNAATGARSSLGIGMPEIPLPAARVLADGHQEDTQETRDLDAPIAEPEPPRNQNNYRITEADKLGTGSLKNKCYANLSAIELLKYLETESRSASQDEKQILLRYVGWGGLPQVFDPLNKTWAEERQQLENLLTPDELDSARATTLNAHYTAPVVIRAMSAALERFGFTHGRILEPALGLGHFIGLIPDEMCARSLITGVEIDSVTTQIGRAHV